MSCNNNSRDPMEVLGRSKGYSRRELIEYLPRHSKFTPGLIREIKKRLDIRLLEVTHGNRNRLPGSIVSYKRHSLICKQF